MGLFSRFRKAPEHKPAQRDVSLAKLKRYYEAAQQTDLAYGWDTVPVPPQWIVRNALKTLRARSREQVQNNEYAKRFLGLLSSNVVGTKGFTCQSQIKNTSGAADSQANGFIEQMMADWSRRENFDVTGRLSRVEHERLFIRTIAQDGEYLARIVRGRQAGKHGIQLQVLDPEILPVWYEKKLGAGNYIEAGIEYSAMGKPVAYHILAKGPSTDTYNYYGKDFVRVPASDIIHEFITEMVGQTRGIPWLATPLMGMKMLAGYEEAALVAARVGAANMGFFESQGGEEDMLGDTESPSGDLEMDAEAGTFRSLPQGVKLSNWNPKYPDSQFGSFVKSTLRRVASGLGVSYNTLANDLEGVNYSSLRQGALEDRDGWSLLQGWMIEVFQDRLYREWLTWQMTSGGKTLPAKIPASLTLYNEQKYMAVRWLPRRWQWVDPQKETEANTAALLHGLKSRSQIIREMGHDPEAIWREIQRENELLQSLGLDFPAEQAAQIKVTEKVSD